jgi:ABC-type nitrate/sulfonate/bicarbonate transport system ATPase subunit
MCDRLVVLSSNPARIAAEIPVLLPSPRSRLAEEFGDIVDEVYAVLTAATAWGRYAELFAYDDKTRMFSVVAKVE